VKPTNIRIQTLLLAALICLPAAAQTSTPAQQQWPNVTVRNGVTNTIYQPQIESWDHKTLKASSAVSVQANNSRAATFGVINFTARTHVDRAERQVVVENIQVTGTVFPSAAEKADDYRRDFGAILPLAVSSLPLDTLEASLGISEARRKTAGQPIKNDPPAIIFSTKPAMLVSLDGPPKYHPVPDTKLQRVANTRALILRDDSGKYFLHLFDGYVTAAALEGPWTIATTIPADVTTAQTQAVKAKQVDLLAGQENPQTKEKPSLRSTPVPTLYVVTAPTELVVTFGDPKWVPLPPTELLYATNTASHIFKEVADQKTYVLISGRWFRSPSFQGPWEFVPASALPKDFANIPDESAQENVKASVSGTSQAQEAAIANDIPHDVKVDRSKATISPPLEYDGAPELKQITGTPLSFVVNCQTPVIKVDERSWYACQNGIWFMANSLNGPWSAATSVPEVIYTIPPSSPLHYVTYVTVSSYDPNFIWSSATPGYYGTEVSPDGVVVYGTGYNYPAYVGNSLYVAYPLTYGYGFNPCWTPWGGWAFGLAAGWATAASWDWWCGCPAAPFWGPYWAGCYGQHYNAFGGITSWGPYGWAGTSGYAYHHNGAWTGVRYGDAGYNPWTGHEWASQYARSYNSTTGMRTVGQRGAVQNVFNGNYAYGRRGAFYNPRTGVAGAGREATIGNEYSGRSATVARGTAYNPVTGNSMHVSGIRGDQGGALDINNHVIADHNGNVYRPDGRGGWQSASRPLATTGRATGFRPSEGQTFENRSESLARSEPSDRFQPFNNEFNARQVGGFRHQSFQMHRPQFGGFHGGGFRGRR
jgi:hypothetical protein